MSNQPDKLKAPEGLVPNCEVIVDKRHQEWEVRWWDQDTDWVYTLHQGYLWPQRQSGQYWRFRMLQEIEPTIKKVFQDFIDYETFTTVPKKES